MSIKKRTCLLLAFGTFFALSACNKPADQPKAKTAAEQTQNTPTATETPSDTTAHKADSATQDTAGATLQQINLKEGEAPVIRGVALDGNRAGSSIDEKNHRINGRPLSNRDIRSIFELNEWISIRLDTDKKSGISAVVIPHVDNSATLSENLEIPDSAPRVDLNAPGDVENALYASWGELYLHPEEWKPGDYDLLFMFDNKPIARIILKFYPEEALADKSDGDLLKIMQNL